LLPPPRSALLASQRCFGRGIAGPETRLTGDQRDPSGVFVRTVQTSVRSFPPPETGKQGNHRRVLWLPRHTQVIETATGIRWIREKSPERTNWIRLLASPGKQTIDFDPQKAIANS
jgi:hypothetical protein